MKVCIVGAGYVGLVSGACLSERGHDVTCVDIDPDIVEALNDGVPHIYERDLDALLKDVRRAGRFKASVDLLGAVANAEMAIIAVGTPTIDGSIDLRRVRSVAHKIGRCLRESDRFLPVVVKSTVVPGTTDTVVRGELEAASGKSLGSFGLGMNPEFLREGAAVADFMEPDRIVLGYEDETTLSALERLYAVWDCDKIRVNTRTAELIKYANNALLATQISAINEIANLAEAIGDIDMIEVAQGLHLDRRWNPVTDLGRLWPDILTYLVPGCGFGGSCLPKDVRALLDLGQRSGLPMQMLRAVVDVNDAQPLKVAERLDRENLAKDSTVLLLGLAFKPETDDVRESASLVIARSLLERGISLMAHDPIAAENFRAGLGRANGDVRLVSDWRQHIDSADAIVIATKWPEYSELRSMNLKGKLVFDCRRMFCKEDFPEARYLSIGMGRTARDAR